MRKVGQVRPFEYSVALCVISYTNPDVLHTTLSSMFPVLIPH